MAFMPFKAVSVSSAPAVTPKLDEKLQSAGIHTEVYGSDHCPVELVADV